MSLNKAEMMAFLDRTTATLVREITEIGDKLAESTPDLDGGPLKKLSREERFYLYHQARESINTLQEVAHWAVLLSDHLEYRLDAWQKKDGD